MAKYQHIFFDLDHTLWDFAKNADQTLREIFDHFQLQSFGLTEVDAFIAQYTQVNDRMWDDYRNDRITKTELRSERFRQTLTKFNIDQPQLSVDISDFYLFHSPRKTNLFAHTIETLNYLKEKYELHIITNGFEEVQQIKMSNSGLESFFKHVVTSEGAGVKKPHRDIFLYALKTSGAKRQNSLMIGDNLPVDCVGARQVGIDQVYFNPELKPHEEKVTYEIDSLKQLTTIL